MEHTQVYLVANQSHVLGLQNQTANLALEVRVADRCFALNPALASEAPGLFQALSIAPRDAKGRAVLDVNPQLFSYVLTFLRDKRWPLNTAQLSGNELKILQRYAQRFGILLLKANIEKVLNNTDSATHVAYSMALGHAAARSTEIPEREELTLRAAKRMRRAHSLQAGPAPLATHVSAPPGMLAAIQTPRHTDFPARPPAANPNQHLVLLAGTALMRAKAAESASRGSFDLAQPVWERALQDMEAVPPVAHNTGAYLGAKEIMLRLASNYLSAAYDQASNAEKSLRAGSTLMVHAHVQSARRMLAAVPPAWADPGQHDRAATLLTSVERALGPPPVAVPTPLTLPNREPIASPTLSELNGFIATLPDEGLGL